MRSRFAYVAFAFAMATSLAAPYAARASAAPTRSVALASAAPSSPATPPPDAPDPLASLAPDPFATLAPADCTLVGGDDIARILGYPVDAPDDASARGGICFFTTRSVSQEGSASYALVTSGGLAQRRAFFRALARRCGSVAAGSSNELRCRAYRNLAAVTDLDSYFKARTDFPDATPVPELGTSAVAAPDAVYVRRGSVVYECAVRLGDTLDVERSTALARLLLARAPQS